jgi:hypothetical protein
MFIKNKWAKFYKPQTFSLIGTPASIKARLAAHTDAIDEEPFDSNTSQSALIVKS